MEYKSNIEDSNYLIINKNLIREGYKLMRRAHLYLIEPVSILSPPLPCPANKPIHDTLTSFQLKLTSKLLYKIILIILID